MADSGIFRIAPLQTWQRESILAAASYLREQFGNPPSDARARAVHDGLLEVLDPPRRAVRLQREMSAAAKLATTAAAAALAARPERRGSERRQTDRRKLNLGPPSGSSERRKGERRTGRDRRTKR